ncbi:unnamed protein product [Caenorhabditis bovis]|uniref:Uncharacterized protein n=1 Tax=Caenorhabditis bovis TaxID=2654633 RepID=A0A8S1EKF4_9PELO|nr:unnamed protein product [Caenorhabditis bovis]
MASAIANYKAEHRYYLDCVNALETQAVGKLNLKFKNCFEQQFSFERLKIGISIVRLRAKYLTHNDVHYCSEDYMKTTVFFYKYALFFHYQLFERTKQHIYFVTGC